jgi:hypothetical protein
VKHSGKAVTTVFADRSRDPQSLLPEPLKPEGSVALFWLFSAYFRKGGHDMSPPARREERIRKPVKNIERGS